jgi:MarR family transcriptional regulator, lower aerobic nicotinate degradation pathway regulator
LTRRPGFLLRKAHQVAVAIFMEEAGHLALTPPQHNVLTAVRCCPGWSQADIGRVVGYDRATVGAVLAGLEARGLVRRAAGPGNRKTVSLTPDGRTLLSTAQKVTERINERVVAGLSEAQRRQLVKLLTRIAGMAETGG